MKHPMIAGAIITLDGKHRTRLWRIWDDTLPRMLLVMLNPSTADASVPDPTVTRGIGFAKREGCGGLEVVNLYSLRTKSPAVLKAQQFATSPDNDRVLRAMLGIASGPVVCGWGAHAHAEDAANFRTLAAELGVSLYHLGPLNANGSPKHPLYLKGDTPLVEWRLPGEVETLEPFDDSDYASLVEDCLT